MRLPLLSLIVAASLVGCASTGPERVTDADLPRAVGTGTPVSVSWGDPAQFTELRYSHNRHEAAQGDWVEDLASHVAKRVAKVLPAGETVEVEIVDIERAGEYEWAFGRTDDVRVLRDVYPPRMELRFQRMDANGNVIAEGERRLSDLAYLTGSQPLSASDPLRFEKRMIDQWVRKEFVSRR
jgi:hypothetical protein